MIRFYQKSSDLIFDNLCLMTTNNRRLSKPRLKYLTSKKYAFKKLAEAGIQSIV